MRMFLFLLLFSLFSCGGDGGRLASPGTGPPTQHTPEISNLALFPDTATYMEGGGNVVVTAQIGFRDTGLDIQTLWVLQSDGTKLESNELINAETGTLTEQFVMSTETVGAFNVEFWLVDKAGDSSNHVSAEMKVQNPAPELATLNPAGVWNGSTGFSLSISGTGFLAGATVTWDGADRTTDFVSDKQVIASIPATDLVTPGTFSVRVRNPEPTTGPSNALDFEVAALPSPEPEGFPLHITETIDGSPPNGPSVNGGLDWLGNYVVFASKASNLVAGDSNDAYDLFIRETCLGTTGNCTPATVRAVLGIGGAEPNGDIGWTLASPDNSLGVSFNGRFITFVSSASNLVPNDSNGVDDVYLTDTCAGNPWPPEPSPCTPGVIRVSLGNDGSQSTAPASYPAVADDGRYVVFVSSDPNLVAGDTNGVADIFLHDTCRGAAPGCAASTMRVSVATNGSEANAASGEPAFTGRYVAFSSLASNLVAGDSNGIRDIFLRDTCIGEPGCTPSTRLVSVGLLGNPADGASSDPQVSWGLADFYGHDQHGRFVVFVSSATNLVPGDTNGASDVFERDLCAGEPGCTPSTTRVSVTGTGGQIGGDSWSPDYLRWDGETIPFVTATDGVVAGDSNGIADVFVRHYCPLHSGAPGYCVAGTRRISVGTAGAQTDGDSYAPRMSHDPFGAWAITFISEASNILPDSVAIPNDGCIYMDLAY